MTLTVHFHDKKMTKSFIETSIFTVPGKKFSPVFVMSCVHLFDVTHDEFRILYENKESLGIYQIRIW